MALIQGGYQAWDITSQADKVLSIAEQLKNSYKGFIHDPANTNVDVEKRFAASHLFFTDKDLYYSRFRTSSPAYVVEFLDNDDRAPHRGFYKRTEVGIMYPEIVKSTDVPGPGKELVWKRREPVNIWQDESADIPDIHFRNSVDFHMFDFSRHFLDANSYALVKNSIFNAMRAGNAQLEKLWVDTFIATILGVWSYPMGDPLFQFFTGDDTYVPEETYSKVANLFLKKDGEMRKSLELFRKYILKHYVNRFPYLTNINQHEIIGQSQKLTIPKHDKMLADKSDASKILKYVQKCYLSEGSDKKLTEVGYSLRRLSIDSLSSVIFKVLDRMMSLNAMNWCGHEYGKDVKDKEGVALQCEPENLIVFMNNEDLKDMYKILGSQITGPFTETQTIQGTLASYRAMGVRFYGLNFILPSMAVIVDKVAFRFVEYFNESYSRFHEFDLVEATVHHMFKKPVLYKYAACTVVEPAEDQKFALPIGWGSEHLPYLRESS